MSCGTEFTQATLINATGARLQALQEELQPITMDNIIHDFSTQPRYVFNVYFHKVVADDGTTPDEAPPTLASSDGIGDGDLIVEETYLEAVRALNIKYNRFNIFFKYRGFDIIRNSNFLIINDYISPNNPWEQLKEWARVNNNPDTGLPYYKADGLNLYIVQRFTNAPSTGGILGLGELLGNESVYAYRVFQPEPIIAYDGIYEIDPAEPYDYINGVVAHEIGHNLNLVHPSSGSFRIINGVPMDFTEHVTRDITNQYYNAASRGDLIIDTRADINTSRYVDLANCSCDNAALAADNVRDYSTWVYDANTNHYIGTGQLYIDLPSFNIMAAYFSIENRIENQSSHCNYARQFTDGQGTRMHETLANNPSIFNPLLTTEASLYEPYKVVATYGGSGAGDTTLMLESRLSFQAPYWTGNVGYFQPGFDYEVYNCSSCTQTTTGLFTTYDKYDSAADCSHYLPEHAIKILQLGDATGECAPLPMVHAIGGSVYSHNSATYTAQPLDSLNINSPDLLLNLPDGVHTIKVTTDTGNVLEKTIQITH